MIAKTIKLSVAIERVPGIVKKRLNIEQLIAKKYNKRKVLEDEKNLYRRLWWYVGGSILLAV